MDKEKESIEIITDLEQLGLRADEIDVREQGRLCQEIILKLKRTIREKGIVALSAPQIGYPYRIFCAKFGRNDLKTFINPMITQAGELGLIEETCSSIPGQKFKRPRHISVTIMYQTPLGQLVSVKLSGQTAAKIQHQIDHLDGMLLPYVALPLTDDFYEYTQEEQDEIIEGYIESLDLKRKDVVQEIQADPELKELSDAIDFMEDVAKGNTKVTVKQFSKEKFGIPIETKSESESKEQDK